MPIQALILAGGLGSRLGERVKNSPKPLLTVDGKPFLIKIIERLADQGVADCIICVGYKAEKIIDFFGDGSAYGISISYSREKGLLGTGGAVLNALHLINHEDVVVMNGDSFCYFDIPKLMKSHREKRSTATLALVKVSNASRFGVVKVDSSNKVVSFDEKNSQRMGAAYINAGVYVLGKSFISSISPGRPVSLERDVFPANVSRNMHGFLLSDNRFIDIGTPAALDSAGFFFREE